MSLLTYLPITTPPRTPSATCERLRGSPLTGIAPLTVRAVRGVRGQSSRQGEAPPSAIAYRARKEIQHCFKGRKCANSGEPRQQSAPWSRSAIGPFVADPSSGAGDCARVAHPLGLS